MTRPDARTLDFFDRNVISLIVQKYGLDDRAALNDFINSQTYKMLCDAETLLYASSPLILFDMWENEKITGEPRNSQYIRQ